MTLKRMGARDRAAVLSGFYTVEQIGPQRALTPEGFLLCYAVPFARTGEMLYGPGETPIKTRDGLARVTRDASALFSPECMNSFNGKAVVDEHPPVDVTPENWEALSCGTVFNVRRGEGEDSDCLVADFLITKKQTIRDVLDGKREVSAGYDADYEQTGDGAGRQTNIIGNHIALVNRGRCGPRCAIGDHQPTEVSMTMKGTTQPRRVKIAEKIRQIFRDAEASLADDPDLLGGSDDMDEGGTNGATHIHIHAGGAAPGGGGEAATEVANGDPATQELGNLAAAGQRSTDDQTEARFQALEQGHEEIKGQLAQIMQMLGGGDPASAAAPPAGGEGGPPSEETKDEALPGTEGDDGSLRGKTGDSAALERSYSQLASQIEILVPGYRLPTFDSKLARAKTVDMFCAQRRAVLAHMNTTVEGKSLLDSVVDGLALGPKTSCADVATLFASAVAAKRVMNNAAATRDSRTTPQPKAPAAAGVRSPADLNRFYAEYHAGKKH